MKADKILIIEDNPDNVNIISLFLEGEGCEIFIASNGTKGIQRAEMVQPDLILLDILMPGIDGYETCRQLKTNEKTKDIPVIFLSALSETFDKVEAFRCGGVDYVTKPIQAEELSARVNSHLSIRHLQKDLQEHNRNLEYLIKQRTDDLVISNIELRQAKEKAEEGNKLKTAFLQNISHEVRTPLNAILGFSELLHNMENKESKISTYIDYIHSSGIQLLHIIEDILLISKIESNQLEQVSSVFNIEIMLNEVELEYSTIAYHKGLSFEITKNFTPNLNVNLNEIHLRQVLNKLIDNAIKFTHEGYVQITVGNEKTDLIISVTDTGIGIDANDFDRIYEPFRQLDFSETRNYGGTGIGLTICKALVEKMGGQIQITSKRNSGSTFRLSFPNVAVGFSEYFESTGTKSSIKNNTQVLVVDDIESNYQLLYENLTKMDMTVYYAQSGYEAISVYQSNPLIDLVIMDLKMPGMNGYEAARVLKGQNPALHVIAFSAYDVDVSDESKAIFTDVLQKPLDFKHFLKTISPYISIQN